jgi:2-keto-4-pentenoate hydratase
MDVDYCDEIGTWLLDLRENERTIADPQALPPCHTLQDVYNVLSGTCKTTSTLGDHVGWKCGACDPQAWTKLGLTEPFRAPLHRNRVFQQSHLHSPTSIPTVLQRGLLAVEAEFAFIMGQSLPPRTLPYTQQELWDAVAVVVPAIEVVGTRWSGRAFQQATGFQKIVDFGLNQNCVLGPNGVAGSSCRQDLDKVAVKVCVNGVQVGTGSGKNVLEHPILALGWLASNLNACQVSTNTHRYGGGDKSGLLKGDVVMSGATVVITAFKPGDVITASFEGVGEVSVVLALPDSKL